MEFFKIGKNCKFAVECVSSDIFLMFFFLSSKTELLHSIRTFLVFKKLEGLMKSLFFRKYRFHSSKTFFKQSWRAENFPIVAECLND